jgi:lysophospholipase L1-like esterase
MRYQQKKLRTGPAILAQPFDHAADTALYYMPFMTADSLIAAFAKYNEVIRAIANDESIALIDIATALPTEGNFVDTVHLNDQGAETMGKLVSAALQNAMERKLS